MKKGFSHFKILTIKYLSSKFLIITFAFLIGQYAAKAQNLTRTDSLLINARSFVEQNDLSNALRNYLRITNTLEKQKNYQELKNIYTEIGLVYHKGGLHEKAIEYFKKAQNSTQKQDLSLKKNIADAYFSLKNYEKALGEYDDLATQYKKNQRTDSAIIVLENAVQCHQKLNNHQKALEYNEYIFELVQNAGAPKNIAAVLNNIGYNYKNQKKYDLALKYFLKTLEQKKQYNADEKEIIPTYINLGIVYQNMDNYDRAHHYLHQAYLLSQKHADQKQLAQLKDLQAVVYFNAKDYYNATTYNQQSLEIAEKLNDVQALQMAYKTKSMIAEKQEEYKDALYFYQKYLSIRDSIAFEQKLQQQFLLREQFMIERAERELEMLLADEEIKTMNMRQLQLENEKKAKEFELLKRDKELQDARLQEQENQKQKALQQLLIAKQQFDAEKRQRQIEELERNKQVQDLELREEEQKRKLLENQKSQLEKENSLQEEINKEATMRQQFAYGIIFLICCVLGLAVWGLAYNRKQNKLLIQKNTIIQNSNTELSSKNREIQAQKEELLTQAEELQQANEEINAKSEALEDVLKQLEKRNEDITASITYASRIQEAFLPTSEVISEYLPHHFVLFKPRDIVSGDFYWFETIDDKHIIVVADCTGHGVPGAFMSLIGNDLLIDIVRARKITQPQIILEEMHKGVRYALRQDRNKSRDGMDMSIAVVNKKTKTIEYAGAMNPIYFIQSFDNQADSQKAKEALNENFRITDLDDNHFFVEIKADKKPIGGSQDLGELRTFTLHTFPIADTTKLYLFSDGYQDQFGGKEGKKFMVGKFKKLFQSIHHQSLDQQKITLDNTIKEWMTEGNEHQIDDILVIGIQV